MTALARYARLETTGLWRPAPDAPAREVVVSFGNATLVLSDGGGLPLAHWSLPAVARLNPGEAPALFAPDEDGSETVAIDDDTMVSAIETVRRSVHPDLRAAPRARRRLAGPARALAFALLLLPAVLLVPRLLRHEALAVIPPSKAAEIGATLLGLLQRDLGPACRDPLGGEALQRLAERTLGEGARAVVLPLGPLAPAALPGGITVVSRDAVERAAEPAALAGHLLAARAIDPDPLASLLDRAGALATAGLLTSGALDEAAVEGQAAALLARRPLVPDAALLGPAFAAAQVPLTPYALDLDPSGDAVGALLNADALQGEALAPLLSDADWVALQAICLGG